MDKKNQFILSLSFLALFLIVPFYTEAAQQYEQRAPSRPSPPHRPMSSPSQREMNTPHPLSSPISKEKPATSARHPSNPNVKVIKIEDPSSKRYVFGLPSLPTESAHSNAIHQHVTKELQTPLSQNVSHEPWRRGYNGGGYNRGGNFGEFRGRNFFRQALEAAILGSLFYDFGSFLEPYAPAPYYVQQPLYLEQPDYFLQPAPIPEDLIYSMDGGDQDVESQQFTPPIQIDFQLQKMNQEILIFNIPQFYYK